MYKKVLGNTPAMYIAAEGLCRSRESGNEPAEEEKTSLEMTAYVFAPLVVSFCVWMLKEAEKIGLKRVYFLSRDGYQFYRCAKKIAEVLGSGVEVRYLYVSRYSLRIPCFFLMGEEALAYICLRGMEVNFLDLMERAGLTHEEAAQTAEEIGYRKRLEDPIPLTQIPGFRDRLKNSPFFMRRMEEISRAAFENTAKYLMQEGLLDDVNWGIADSGWTGTTQQILAQLLGAVQKEKMPPRFHGFYFGLYDLPAGADASAYHTYYFSPEGNLNRKAEFANSLFEAVFGAPHGMATGYKKTKTSVVPKLSDGGGLQQKKIRKQTERILCFVRIWAAEADRQVLSREQLHKMLRLFMGMPDMEEAVCYGNYRFSDDVTERRTHPLALPMTEEELMSGHILEKFVRLYVKKYLPVKESAWYEGSAMLFSERAAWHQRCYRRYKKLIYIRKRLERKLGK